MIKILLSFLFSVSLFAQLNSEDEVFFGSIADTDINTLLEDKDKFKPSYGIEDIYLTPESSAVLRFDEVPIESRKDLYVFVTNQGFVKAGSPNGLTPKQSRITANKKLGSTQLLFFNKVEGPDGKPARGDKLYKGFRVTVTKENMIELMQEMKAKIGQVEGLEIRIIGSQIVVDGKVLVPKDMRRVLTVIENYRGQGKQVENLAEISPKAFQLLAQKMEDEIAGGPDRPKDIRVRVLNGKFVLEGSVDKRIDRELAVQTCKAMQQDQFAIKPQNLTFINYDDIGECILRVRIRAGPPLDPDGIINVRVDFVTMNRDYLKSFDFRWSPGTTVDSNVNYSTDTGQFLSSFAAVFTSLFPRLRNLKRNGHARILKTATLMVRDGDDTSSGGGAPPEGIVSETVEIPYFNAGNEEQNGQWAFKPVTTSISIKAKSITGTDKISLDIDATQTEAGAAPSENAPPPTSQNRVKTALVVSNGESAALGGMLSERLLVNNGREPASDSSAGSGFNLFNLSKQNSYNTQKSQMIIFISPLRLRNASEGTDKLKRKFRLRR